MRRHACTTHRIYRLTCEDYDLLLDDAAGMCARCDSPTDRLNIDHDHALGMAAVRGLVCALCNSHLGLVDAGRREPDDRDRAYLAGAWHLSREIEFHADTRTAVRTLRADDELWEAAQERAANRRESVADVIRRALLAYVETPTP